MTDPYSPLRLNVGLFLNQSIGYTRDFEFELSHARLEPDVDVTNLAGTARITRTPQGLLLQASLGADMQTECVRCLTDAKIHLENEYSELYAFNHRSVSESGLILPDNGYIDLTPLAREYLVLAIPISPLCRPDCKGLCLECGQNLNEGLCEHTSRPVDPRLAALKSLLPDDQ